MFSDSVNLLTA